MACLLIILHDSGDDDDDAKGRNNISEFNCLWSKYLFNPETNLDTINCSIAIATVQKWAAIDNPFLPFYCYFADNQIGLAGVLIP